MPNIHVKPSHGDEPGWYVLLEGSDAVVCIEATQEAAIEIAKTLRGDDGQIKVWGLDGEFSDASQ